MNKREEAIKALVEYWRELVINDDVDRSEMHDSLVEQVDHACQGWDSSLEDLDEVPECREIMGYGEDLTDEQAVEWQEIVDEAAQVYLEREDDPCFMVLL